MEAKVACDDQLRQTLYLFQAFRKNLSNISDLNYMSYTVFL